MWKLNISRILNERMKGNGILNHVGRFCGIRQVRTVQKPILPAFLSGIMSYFFDSPAYPLLPSQTLPTRKELLERAKEKKVWDVLIVGAGSAGAGAALDATTRGLSTLCIEAEDFASGTSSRSTKLIHGGVRYLEKAFKQLDYPSLMLVFEALSERRRFINNAPHLCRPLAILTPCYTWWEGPYYWAGLKLYDLLAGSQKLYWSYWVSARESERKFPMVKKNQLKGSVCYFDGQFDDSRMNLALAMSALGHGATVLNHVEVVDVIKNGQGRIVGARLRDHDAGEEWDVSCHVVLNTTGPFSDSIRKMSNPQTSNIIVPSSGVHVVLPNYYSPEDMGLIIPKTKDGRVIFLLPWLGNTIAGTTDTKCEISRYPHPHEHEINFILDSLKDYVDIDVRREDVKAAWSGIRPLALDPSAKETSQISRDHIIEVDNGMVTLAGGKWTTYRRMAQEVIDKAIEVGDLKPSRKCQTENLILWGGEGWSLSHFVRLEQHFQRTKRTSRGLEISAIHTDIAKHLSTSYGTRAELVLKIAKDEAFGNRLHENHPFIEAEVVYAIRNEYALTAVDVIARRLRLAFLDAHAAQKTLPKIVKIMSQQLNWSPEKEEEELRRGSHFLDLMTVGSEESVDHANFAHHQ